jgi:hypothetical protein
MRKSILAGLVGVASSIAFSFPTAVDSDAKRNAIKQT